MNNFLDGFWRVFPNLEGITRLNEYWYTIGLIVGSLAYAIMVVGLGILLGLTIYKIINRK